MEGRQRSAETEGIELPDLTTTESEIVADNIRAIQPAYFAAMFEELKAFQVADKLVELFQNGALPIGSGSAGKRLFKYWNQSGHRIPEAERRTFYARTFGLPGGDDGGVSNREFNDLFIRFVSAVASFVRQQKVDPLLNSEIPEGINQQELRRAGRELAANLSSSGDGWAYFMAPEVKKQVDAAIKILSEPEIKSAYGARDMWQVIDEVAALELGGKRNSTRYRTMAMSGNTIIAWLCKNSRKLSSTKSTAPLNVDTDLINACEQWLAVTGVPDNEIENEAAPTENPPASASLK